MVLGSQAEHRLAPLIQAIWCLIEAIDSPCYAILAGACDSQNFRHSSRAMYSLLRHWEEWRRDCPTYISLFTQIRIYCLSDSAERRHCKHSLDILYMMRVTSSPTTVVLAISTQWPPPCNAHAGRLPPLILLTPSRRSHSHPIPNTPPTSLARLCLRAHPARWRTPRKSRDKLSRWTRRNSRSPQEAH
eukprot:6179457-Pleurochrysis_carterae.AAC.1